MPYLVSVDDPHSDLSPVNRWGPTPIPETTIRKGLKLRTPVTALKLTRGASGRVLSVRRHDGGRNLEGDRRRASLGCRAALDVDHRPGDALAHASRRACGLRQAADRDREGGRCEGRGAVTADRRRLDAGRRPGRAAGLQGEAPGACELPHLGGQADQRRAEGSRRAGRDRARRRHVDRLGRGEAARRPAPRWNCRSTTAAVGRPRRRPRPARPASTRSRRRSPACTECVSRLRRASPRDSRDRSSFGEAVRARGRRGGALCACCRCRTLRRRCSDDRRSSAPARRAAGRREPCADPRTRRRPGDAAAAGRSARRHLRRAAPLSPARIRAQ